MISLSAFCRKRVRRGNGERLGRIHEVHVEGGRVVSLICGAGGWAQRLMFSRKGHRVEVKDIIDMTADELVIAGN